jgi:hypothetical protein
MKLFSVIYNDAALFPHFLRHYTAAGVTQFCIAVAPEFRPVVAASAAGYSVRLFDGLDVPDSLLAGTAAISAMRRAAQRDGEWVMIVDLDEFIEFPCAIDAIVETAERQGANVARGIMHDRFAQDGSLPAIEPDTDLAAACPITSRFIRDVMGGCDHKAVLVKGHLNPADNAAHHLFRDERVCSMLLEISHYKWIAGAVERLRASHERVIAAGLPWAVEYRRALDHYDAHGRFAWETFGGRPKKGFVPEAGERCSNCGAPISEKEYRYSLDHFGEPLCRFDQRVRRTAIAAAGG